MAPACCLGVYSCLCFFRPLGASAPPFCLFMFFSLCCSSCRHSLRSGVSHCPDRCHCVAFAAALRRASHCAFARATHVSLRMFSLVHSSARHLVRMRAKQKCVCVCVWPYLFREAHLSAVTLSALMELREQLEVIATTTSLPTSWSLAQSHTQAASSTSTTISSCTEVTAVGRMHGLSHPASLTTRLHSIGERTLAHRVRALQRVRGAHTHPDFSLAKEVDEALRRGMASQTRPPWSPTVLMDDRSLRRHSATSGGLQR